MRGFRKYQASGVALLWCAMSAWSQNAAPERITIALTDPSRPGMVNVSVPNGSITVTGYLGSQVVVESDKRGVKVEESDNTVKVQAEAIGQVDLRLSVPTNTSLRLKCVNGGNIQVENVGGEIEVNGVNASIALKKITGVVVASSVQGRVRVELDAVTPGKPMSFSTLNGDVEVTIPADTKVDVSLQTMNGAIHTEFPITLNPSSRVGKRLTGKLNGGGAQMQLKSLNGSIYLRKLDSKKSEKSK